jgi:low affinity Fe/Cu permease
VNALFARFATAVGNWSGHPLAFVISLALIVVWAVSGPLFGFSDTWQLVVNTATTVITYLLVFVIQNTQNRDSAALHLKLDEIVRALPQARTELVRRHIETATDEEIEMLKAEEDVLVSASEAPAAEQQEQQDDE